ncbi:MAG TPA: mechanosensitive ion channel family protein [Spirochaetota bacterium]|nr:mechanosensitive ion channel family protein [Spirochaetota bacterium]HPJ35319.1 mechanosensitive ion channel family protein [Spirochaetota bacterium]
MFFQTLHEILKSPGTFLPLKWSLAVFILVLFLLPVVNITKRIIPGMRNSRVLWLFMLFALPSLIITGEQILSFTLKLTGNDLSGTTRKTSYVLLWIAGARLASEAIRIFIWENYVRKRTDEPVPRIITKFVSALVYILAIYFIVTTVFTMKITGLIVSSGIVAGVLGLSMQNILSDLIAGIALAIEKPYRIGDWIEFKDGTLGEVIDINWRTTRLLSWENSVYVVPNGKSVEATVHNYSMPDRQYRTIFYVSISSDIPPDTARRILLEAALSCDSVIKNPPPVIRLVDIEKRPYRYMVSASYKDYPSYFAGRDRLMIGIWNNFSKTGIKASSDAMDIYHTTLDKQVVADPAVTELLSGISIFRTLSENEIKRLAQDAEICLFRGGEYISREGETDTSLVIVTAGVVSASHISRDGRETELSRFGMGEALGETSMLTGEPRNSDIKAVTDCQIVKIPGEIVEGIIKERPELLQELADIMARRRLEHESKINGYQKPSTSELLSTYATEMISNMKNFFKM